MGGGNAFLLSAPEPKSALFITVACIDRVTLAIFISVYDDCFSLTDSLNDLTYKVQQLSVFGHIHGHI